MPDFPPHMLRGQNYRSYTNTTDDFFQYSLSRIKETVYENALRDDNREDFVIILSSEGQGAGGTTGQYINDGAQAYVEKEYIIWYLNDDRDPTKGTPTQALVNPLDSKTKEEFLFYLSFAPTAIYRMDLSGGGVNPAISIGATARVKREPKTGRLILYDIDNFLDRKFDDFLKGFGVEISLESAFGDGVLPSQFLSAFDKDHERWAIAKFAKDLPLPPEVSNNGIDAAEFEKNTQTHLDFWKGKKETNTKVYDRLKLYWENLGWKPGSGGSKKSEWTPSGVPWSAAFVSYMLKDHDFPKAASHYKYTENIVNGVSSSWKAYSLKKNPKIVINVGDVIIKTRGSGGPKTEPAYWHSHGDLVYKIENNKAHLAGGNVGDTAKDVGSISVDSNKVITDAGKYIVILKKIG